MYSIVKLMTQNCSSQRLTRAGHEAQSPWSDPQHCISLAWWHIPVISALRRQGWEDQNFEITLSYVVISTPVWETWDPVLEKENQRNNWNEARDLKAVQMPASRLSLPCSKALAQRDIFPKVSFKNSIWGMGEGLRSLASGLPTKALRTCIWIHCRP